MFYRAGLIQFIIQIKFKIFMCVNTLLSFTTPNIQDFISWLDMVMVYHRLCDRRPASRHVEMPTITDAAVAVPVIVTPFFGPLSGHSFWICQIVNSRHIVADSAFMHGGKKIYICHPLNHLCIKNILCFFKL